MGCLHLPPMSPITANKTSIALYTLVFKSIAPIWKISSTAPFLLLAFGSGRRSRSPRVEAGVRGSWTMRRCVVLVLGCVDVWDAKGKVRESPSFLCPQD